MKKFFAQGVVDNDGTILLYTRDHLGSVRELVDMAQNVQARYEYDPYGRVTKVSGPRNSDFLYTGHFWHAQSGLYLTLFRQYDPNLGRWLSRDPLEEADNINMYAYVGNNPINTFDQFGLFGDGCKKGEKVPGHSDFSGGDFFDYTAEDHGYSNPYLDPDRHFRPLAESEADALDAAKWQNRFLFQRAMHRGQDYFPHYRPGYRWKPLLIGKNLGLGHGPDGTKPDNDPEAWKDAEAWTKKMLNIWNKYNPYQPVHSNTNSSGDCSCK